MSFCGNVEIGSARLWTGGYYSNLRKQLLFSLSSKPFLSYCDGIESSFKFWTGLDGLGYSCRDDFILNLEPIVKTKTTARYYAPVYKRGVKMI